MNSFSRRKMGLFCPGIIILAAIVFFFPVWWEGKTFYAFDTLRSFYPWLVDRAAVNNHLLTDPINAAYPYCLYLSNVLFHNCWQDFGELIWWQTPVLGGGPMTGFYTSPFKVLYYLLFDPLTAHDVFLFFHLTAAGIFCYLYLRLLRLRRPAALLGGLLWMFNGYVMCWFEFEAFILLAATLAGGMFFLESFLRRCRLIDWLCLTMILCWAIGIGYAHLLMLQLIFLAAMTVYRTGIKIRKKILYGKQLPILAAVLISFAAGSGSLLLHWDMQKESSRKSYGYSELFDNTGEVLPIHLVTLIYPDFFGSPAMKSMFVPKKSPEQSYNNYSELCIFSGVPTVFLMLTAFFGWRRYPLSRFYLIAAPLILLMCMGTWFYYPLYALVPGLKYTTPTRLLQLFGFSMAVGSAFGFDLLLRRKMRCCLCPVAIWGILSAIMLALPLWAVSDAGIMLIFDQKQIPPELQDFSAKFYAYSSPVVAPSLIALSVGLAGMIMMMLVKGKLLRISGVVIVIAAAIGELMYHGARYNTVSDRTAAFPVTPGLKLLREQTTPFRVISLGRFYINGVAAAGLEDAGGYSTSISNRYQRFMRLYQYEGKVSDFMNRVVIFRTPDSPLLDLFNIKYFLLPANTMVNANPLYSGEIQIFANQNAFERAFFIPRAIICDGEEQAFKQLKKFTRQDFREKVILEGYGKPLPAENAVGKVAIREYSPNRIVIETESNGSGFLVVGNKWHPDWRCCVDNTPQPIYLANGIMQGVEIPAGKHIVTMNFRPVSYQTALVLSSLIWLSLIILTGYCIFKSKRWRHHNHALMRS